MISLKRRDGRLGWARCRGSACVSLCRRLQSNGWSASTCAIRFAGTPIGVALLGALQSGGRDDARRLGRTREVVGLLTRHTGGAESVVVVAYREALSAARIPRGPGRYRPTPALLHLLRVEFRVAAAHTQAQPGILHADALHLAPGAASPLRWGGEAHGVGSGLTWNAARMLNLCSHRTSGDGGKVIGGSRGWLAGRYVPVENFEHLIRRGVFRVKNGHLMDVKEMLVSHIQS